MDTLSCILFEMVFQGGCVEEREEVPGWGEWKKQKTWHQRRKIWLYLEKSVDGRKCTKVNKRKVKDRQIGITSGRSTM